MTEKDVRLPGMEIAISVRRRHRSTVDANWIEKVRGTEGVVVHGEPLFGRVTASATEHGRKELEETLGEAFIVEQVIQHERQAEDPYTDRAENGCSSENSDDSKSQ